MNRQKPILFSGPMVRAIINGQKTQTRRVVKGVDNANHMTIKKPTKTMAGITTHVTCAPEAGILPFKKGDVLWVKETHTMVGSCDPQYVLYRASGYENEIKRHGFDTFPPENEIKWKPSIFMPKNAARIWLEVTDVRVELLRDITEEDAIAEGCRPFFDASKTELVPCPNGNTMEMKPLRGPVYAFQELWDSINAARGYGWGTNPWVMVVEFEQITQPERGL